MQTVNWFVVYDITEQIQRQVVWQIRPKSIREATGDLSHQHHLLHSDKEVHRSRTRPPQSPDLTHIQLDVQIRVSEVKQCNNTYIIRCSTFPCFFGLHSQTGFSLSVCPPSPCTRSRSAPGSRNGWPTCPTPAPPGVGQRSGRPSLPLPETWLEMLLQCNTCSRSFSN